MKQLIRTSSFGKAAVPLRLEDDVLYYGAHTIPLRLVTGLRYGIEPIQLEMFYVGRKYLLSLRTKDATLDIRLRSFLGLSKQYFLQLYTELIDSIWSATFVRLVNETIDHLLEGGAVTIGRCVISRQGIDCKGYWITWPDLSYEKKYNRLTLNHRGNAAVWTNLYYSRDYNASVLAAVLDWLFEQDGLTILSAAESQPFEKR